MKTFVVVFLAVVLFAPVVWGQTENREEFLNAVRANLADEEVRFERLWAEQTRLVGLLAEADALVALAVAAKKDAFNNSNVSTEEYADFARTLRTAQEATAVVATRFEMSRRWIVQAEAEISRLKRAIVRLEIEAEAARIRDEASGK